MSPQHFGRSRRRADSLNHALLLLFSVLAAVALYRFATLLLGGLPWPALP
jgi:hypothetical protein